jgi:hypothetical protein
MVGKRAPFVRFDDGGESRICPYFGTQGVSDRSGLRQTRGFGSEPLPEGVGPGNEQHHGLSNTQAQKVRGVGSDWGLAVSNRTLRRELI